MPISAEMIVHLQSGITTLCVAVVLTEILPDGTDGEVLRFVNLSRNLVIEDETFTAFPMPQRQVQQKEGLDPDNTQMTAVYAGTFNAPNLRAGKWQGARVEYMIVNYEDTSMGPALKKKGYIGKTTLQRFTATPEIRSLSQLLEQEIGELYSEDCRVIKLGDERCMVDLDGTTVDGYLIRSEATVTAVTDKQVFTVSYPAPLKDAITIAPDGHWTRGNMHFLTGNNAPQRIKVLKNVGNVITLYLPANKTIQIGDTLLLTAGCDRKRATCRDKYNNVANIQAEPDTPGKERLFTFPS